MMENIEQGGDEGIKQHRPTNPREQKRKKDAIVNIIFALLTEAALILWISSEFFNGVERPFTAFGMLFLSIALLAFYTAHKLVEFKGFRKHERRIYVVCALCCAVLLLVFYRAFETYSEKIQLANEPKVIPSRVELHRNGIDKITRVLISNPSDSWIYQLTLLIQVESNAAPIGTVHSALAESAIGDKFDDATQKSIGDWIWGIGIGTVGFEVYYPPESARLLILYSLAPKENRALWVRGTFPTNSFAKISIIDWTNAPLVLGTSKGVIFWPGPHSNSTYWHFFPDAVPMDLDFGVKAEPTNVIHTNIADHLDLPMKPFQGTPLQ